MRRGYTTKSKAAKIDEIINNKTEFYSATVNAWFNTKFEHDKSLLTLSAGGIGLLITLISTVGVSSIGILVIYTLSIISFIFSLCALLFIFKQNAKHLEDIVSGTATTDNLLKTLDNVAIISFIIGVILSFSIGFITALNKFNEKENPMTQDKKTTTPMIVSDSINNAARIAPTGTVKLSIEGINKMAPTNNSSAPIAKPSTPSEPKK